MQIKMLADKVLRLEGKSEKVLIDPAQEPVGLGKGGARVVIMTDKQADFDQTNFEGVVIKGPGEYEVGGIEVVGVDASQGKMVYLLNIDGVMVGVVGEVDENRRARVLTKIEEVDVLILRDGVEQKFGLEMAKKWGANFLVLAGMEEGRLKEFLDTLDEEGRTGVESLKVEKDNLPDGLETIVLQK